jgi:hypothetical protein
MASGIPTYFQFANVNFLPLAMQSTDQYTCSLAEARKDLCVQMLALFAQFPRHCTDDPIRRPPTEGVVIDVSTPDSIPHMRKRKRTLISTGSYTTATSMLQGRAPRPAVSRTTGANGLRTSDPLPQFVAFGLHKQTKTLYHTPVDNSSYDGPTNAAAGNASPKGTPAGDQCQKRPLPQDPLARGQLWPTAACQIPLPIDDADVPHKRPRGKGHPMLSQHTRVDVRPRSGATTSLFHRKMPAPVQRIQGTPTIDSDHEI